MLISEVEANTGVGRDLLKENDPSEAIKTLIELPLRKPCEIFLKKGIKTVMSSANKHNIVHNQDDIIEKENIMVTPQEYLLMDMESKPNFEDAGKGYAWIMIDFDSLSDENIDWLFSLEERKDSKENSIGEKGIWFVQPCVMGNLDYKIKIGEYTKQELKEMLSEEEIPDVEFDARLAKFDKKRILLSYNNRYPDNVVILRYPVNKNTTVEEVEEYFSKFAEAFKEQNVEIKSDEDIEKRKRLIKKLEDREMDIN